MMPIYKYKSMRGLIKFQTLLAVLVVSLVSCQDSTMTCHYSCKTCVGESYTLCSSCVEDKNITVVEDPSLSQSQFVNSDKVSGVCTGDVPPKANALGVILLIACSAIAAVVRTPSSIYLVSSLQTISLISFVEIAWVSPVGYLLQSLQYFMIFNWIGSGYKVQDQTMRQRQYYRMDLYMHQSSFLRNVAIVGLIDLALVILIVTLAIWKYRKDKKHQEYKAQQIHSQKQSKLDENLHQEQSQKPVYKEEPKMCQKILEIVLNASLTAFFLLIQETSLVIMVSLRFERPISLAAKGIPIVYCIILLAFLIYVFFNKLWFFANKEVQFIGIWRKIGLPVLTIVPYRITFLIVVFMLLFAIFESFFDFKGGKQKLLSRITFFKLVELIVIILAGAYIITELNRNIQLQTNIIRVFLAIGIIAFFICFFIELFFGIIETYFTNNQVKNQGQNEEIAVMDDKNYLQTNQFTMNEINPNIFDHDGKDKNVMIYDIENEDQIEPNRPVQTKSLRNSLKVQQTKNNLNSNQNGGQNDEDMKDKNGLVVEDMDESEKGKGTKSQMTDETDKAAREKERLKKLQEQQEQKAKKKRQQEAEEAQERARRKKKQEQEQAEERARKKRKYIAQMDPELRKRYGF